MEYQVQQQDIEFLLDDVFDVQSAWSEIEAFADLSPDVVKAIDAEFYSKGDGFFNLFFIDCSPMFSTEWPTAKTEYRGPQSTVGK